MKQMLLILMLVGLAGGNAAGAIQPAVIFSQDVVAVNADGSLVPSVTIEPASLDNMQTHDFELGRGRLLRIETNLRNADQRGLQDVAEAVRRCYRYIEASTGLTLRRGVLLYLVELEEHPLAYSFRAAYKDPAQWGEVRLALIEPGALLSGPKAPASLTDLLYDTLPHELGHDVLETLPQLAHDISGQPSQHTRWFIEGICEVLAKGFSSQEVPELHRQFLALRQVDTVLAEPRVQEAMLTWAQHNDNGLVQEADLYGAAMLTMLVWTETVPLTGVIERVAVRNRTVRGADIVAMMQEMTGRGTREMLQHAQAHGTALSRKVLLAKRD